MVDPQSACDGGSSEQFACPACQTTGRGVPTVTLFHHLNPEYSREVKEKQKYAVCRERSCSILYFSTDWEQSWTVSNVHTLVGFKQPEDDSPHPICYCFGYTKENITEEIDRTGETKVIEWITERTQNEECACEYKNPTGRCCLGNVRNTVKSIKNNQTR